MTNGMPKRLNAPRLAVRHSELERHGDSAYTSKCVHADCDGIMLVGRKPGSMELLARDRCVGCGQAVLYIDIDEMRDRFWGSR